MNCLFKTISLIFVILLTSCSEEAEEHLIVIKNHYFDPPILKVSTGKKIKLVIQNNDKELEEFESFDLNREKIIIGNGGKIVIYVGPLKTGEYKFFGDFHPQTAQGKLICE